MPTLLEGIMAASQKFLEGRQAAESLKAAYQQQAAQYAMQQQAQQSTEAHWRAQLEQAKATAAAAAAHQKVMEAIGQQNAATAEGRMKIEEAAQKYKEAQDKETRATGEANVRAVLSAHGVPALLPGLPVPESPFAPAVRGEPFPDITKPQTIPPVRMVPGPARPVPLSTMLGMAAGTTDELEVSFTAKGEPLVKVLTPSQRELNRSLIASREAQTDLAKVNTDVAQINKTMKEMDLAVRRGVGLDAETQEAFDKIALLHEQVKQAKDATEQSAYLTAFERENGPIQAYVAKLGVIAAQQRQITSIAATAASQARSQAFQAGENLKTREAAAARQERDIEARAAAKPMPKTTEGAFITSSAQSPADMPNYDVGAYIENFFARLDLWGGPSALSSSARKQIGINFGRTLGRQWKVQSALPDNLKSMTAERYWYWSKRVADLANTGGGPPQPAPGGAISGDASTYRGTADTGGVSGGGRTQRPVLAGGSQQPDYYAIGEAAAKDAAKFLVEAEQQLARDWQKTLKSMEETGGATVLPDTSGMTLSLWARGMLEKGSGTAGYCGTAVRQVTGIGFEEAHQYMSLLDQGWSEVPPSQVRPGENCIIVDPTMAKGVGHVDVGAFKDGKLVAVGVMTTSGHKKGDKQGVTVRSLSRNAHVLVRR